jgi:broad specificity polyphosphatase/5'/3'-nucleotidase SurE
MTTNTIEKKETKKKVNIPLTSSEDYVKMNFTLQQGEHHVKHCSVGENRFRVNFYTKKDPKAQFSDYYISRSYYIVCTATEDGWEHDILKS